MGYVFLVFIGIFVVVRVLQLLLVGAVDSVPNDAKRATSQVVAHTVIKKLLGG